METLVGLVITIQCSNLVIFYFPSGVTITFPLGFNFPSLWNPNLGVTQTLYLRMEQMPASLKKYGIQTF